MNDPISPSRENLVTLLLFWVIIFARTGNIMSRGVYRSPSGKVIADVKLAKGSLTTLRSGHMLARKLR